MNGHRRRRPEITEGFYLHVTKGWRGSPGPTARKRGIRDRRAEKAKARQTMLDNIAAERSAEAKRMADLHAFYERNFR
jgi:hypothetical protein